MLVCEKFDFKKLDGYYDDAGVFKLSGTNGFSRDERFVLKAGHPVLVTNRNIFAGSIWVVPASACELRKGHTHGSIVVYGQVLVTCNKEAFDKTTGQPVFPDDVPDDTEPPATFEAFMHGPYKKVRGIYTARSTPLD